MDQILERILYDCFTFNILILIFAKRKRWISSFVFSHGRVQASLALLIWLNENIQEKKPTGKIFGQCKAVAVRFNHTEKRMHQI
ncbi:MAG TPA: hypothetical protein DIS88_04925 [Prevotella sp.]|nr:hypothetical protein [Prevotella sp.]